MKFKSLCTLSSLCALLSVSAQAEITKIEKRDIVAPIMINRDFNPVLGMNFVSEGNSDTITGFELSIKNCKAKDIESIQIYSAAIHEKNKTPLYTINSNSKIVASTQQIPKLSSIRLSANFKTEVGNNYFWVSITPKASASLTQKIEISVKSVSINNSKKTLDNFNAIQRFGYAITTPNQEVNICEAVTGKVLQKKNCKFFRIPGIARTNKGSIIAVFDNRYNHNGDLPAEIDVAIRRSTDGGKTWSPIQTVINRQDIPGIGNGVGDPAILVDKKTGRIWVAGLTSPKTGHPIWKSELGTADPAKCGSFVIVYSDDDGQTWSKPINITESIKRLKDADTKEWGCLFQGPGNGIMTSKGVLVFPGQIWGQKHMGVLVYSKDHGKTWTSSKAMEFGGSESQVAELSDGSLMLNTREGSGGWRQVGVTKDLGETWTKHPSVSTEKGRLRNPVCQGCLVSAKKILNFPHVLFFSNPNAGSRCNMSLKYSIDDGNTWSEGLTYDQRDGMGYSAIIPVDKQNLGVLYEGEHHYLYFLKIPFKEIFKK